MARRSRPVEITDAPEHRSIPIERIELRSDGGDDSNEIVLEGYASTFEEYEMYGGPSGYGWIERIDRHAFDKTLREKPDLHLLINHAGTPLARTKSGTLDLSVDDHGLKVVARLDKRDPDVQGLAVKMERGDMDEMSFAFRVKAQEWSAAPGYEDQDDFTYRLITEVSLHKGDVSVVNFGANPTTSASIRSAQEALRLLAELPEEEFAEIRGDEDIANLKIVQERLSAYRRDGILSVNDIREELNEAESRDEDVDDDCGCSECTCGKAQDEGEEDVEEAPEVRTEEGVEEAEAEATVSDEEEVGDEASEQRDEPKGMSLRDALAIQGIIPEDEGRLSLAAALALAE
ncbi:HK97 family phage prohead protease [Mycolicibacterium phlei RIVM601174]|nr:HK97 family phage prohead protease [Mycolicibacterium phlei RIVM601174]